MTNQQQQASQGAQKGGAPPLPFLAPASDESLQRSMRASSIRLYEEIWKPNWEATEKHLADFWGQPDQVRYAFYMMHEPLYITIEAQIRIEQAFLIAQATWQAGAAAAQQTGTPFAEPPPQPPARVIDSNGLPFAPYWANLASKWPQEVAKMKTDWENLVLQQQSLLSEVGSLYGSNLP